jgi:hypothetical protein
MLGDCVSDSLLHFFRGRHPGQRHSEQVRGGAAKVHVRVVEAGHHKLPTKLNRFDAFLTAAAIEQHMVQIADAANLPIGNGHGFGPGKRWIIGINAAVDVVSRTGIALRRAELRLKYRNNCKGGK